MKNWKLGLAATAALVGVPAHAATIKLSIAGPLAHYDQLFKDGVEPYLAAQGGKLAGYDVQFVYRDNGHLTPGATRNLGRQPIVEDKVSHLASFVLTPNALAVAPLIQQSKASTLIFNAATSGITGKSGYHTPEKAEQLPPQVAQRDTLVAFDNLMGSSTMQGLLSRKTLEKVGVAHYTDAW